MSAINRDELAICRRRGHSPTVFMDSGWVPCKWCGAWVREVKTTTIEEREDEPPEQEQSPFARRLK